MVGKGEANELEPVTIGVLDAEEQRFREKSKRVMDSGARYTNEERDRILARLHLGL